MRIVIGSDHAGFRLKGLVIAQVQAAGHSVVDLGAHSDDPVDYPPICAAVGREVVAGRAQAGIVLGGSGQGEQIAANKVPGVRAALCNDVALAELARAHNDANVLAIGARLVDDALAARIVDRFLTTPFDGGRHERRVDQITALEGRSPPFGPWHLSAAAATAGLPEGTRWVDLLRHGSLEVRWWAPDPAQAPVAPDRDQLYLVASGRAVYTRGEERIAVAAGDLVFTPATARHRFEDPEPGFATWVVSWGPPGGEP